jgi:hypothetical protein
MAAIRRCLRLSDYGLSKNGLTQRTDRKTLVQIGGAGAKIRKRVRFQLAREQSSSSLQFFFFTQPRANSDLTAKYRYRGMSKRRRLCKTAS